MSWVAYTVVAVVMLGAWILISMLAEKSDTHRKSPSPASFLVGLIGTALILAAAKGLQAMVSL